MVYTRRAGSLLGSTLHQASFARDDKSVLGVVRWSLAEGRSTDGQSPLKNLQDISKEFSPTLWYATLPFKLVTP